MKKGTTYSIFIALCSIIYSCILAFPHGERHGWIIRMIKNARAKAKARARAKKIAKKDIQKYKDFYIIDVTSHSSDMKTSKHLNKNKKSTHTNSAHKNNKSDKKTLITN